MLEKARRTPVRLLALGALLTAVATPATPATAIPPHSFDEPQIAALFPDVGNQLVGFLNFSRDGFCAWEASGFEGPPPFLDSVSAWLRVNGNGEVKGTAKGELPLELWPMDDDATLEGPCQDSDDATEPFASGPADVKVHDLDPFGTSDGRGAFSARLGIHGDVTAPDGTRYKYQLTVISVIDGQGRVRHLDSDHQRLVELP